MAIARIGVVVVLALGAITFLASPTLAEPEEILPPPPTTPAEGETEGIPEGAPPTAAESPAEPVAAEGTAAGASPADWRSAPEGKLADRNGPKLPLTAGRTEADARQRLSGWSVRIENVVGAGQYVGKVVDQHPDPGTTLARGETVTVVIAVAGLPDRHHRSVPNIEGKDYQDALPMLTNRGEYYAVPKTVAHSATPGTIIDQMPRPGSVAKKGTPVVVLVSRGGGELPPAAAPAEIVPDVPVAPSEVLPPPPSAVRPAPSEHEAMPLPAPPTAPTPPASDAMPLPMPPLPTTPPQATPEPAPLPAPVAPPPVAPAPRKLTAPRLLAPEGGRAAPRAYGATFGWTAVPGAEGYEWELQVEVATDQWETKDTQTVKANQFRPKRLEKGRFRWRIRAIREGMEGAWSEFRRLYAY